jgi:hypothetical protein
MSEGPLARAWAELEIDDGKSTVIEMEMMRMMFFYGARSALIAFARNPLCAAHMSAEIRDFDKERKALHDDARDQDFMATGEPLTGARAG